MSGEQQLSQMSQASPGPSAKRARRTCTEHNNNSYDIENVLSENSASCGILERVIVKNFMCHDYLNFAFTSNINFVHGRNGSGKSAILIAVVVGLGGTTRITNRGNSLKELVKYGKQTAVIEIFIKNCGSDAFRPEQYGNKVIVERRIQAAGAGGYRLKSEKGSVISTKKDDLLRMLEHFNLQVDNPVTLLNQDMSRSFLSTTDPKMLYKFFLKATQLQQMKDDYNQLEKAILASLAIIQSRREALPLLEKEVEEQQAQYEFSVSLMEKKKKLIDLRHELAWAMVIEKESEVNKAENALAAHKASRDKLQEKIDILQKKYDVETSQHKKNEDEFNKATGQLMSISKQVKQASNNLRKLKDNYKDAQAQLTLAEKKVRVIQKEISTLKEAIEKDNDETQSQWAVAQEEWKKKMNVLQAQMKDVAEHLKTEDTHCQNLQSTMEQRQADKMQLVMEEKAAKRNLYTLEKELKGLQSQQGSHLTVFGRWVPQLLHKIGAAHARGEFSKKPVGPLGAFIELRDNKWGHVVEAVLGNRITGFCVDNQRDEQTLRKVMSQVNFDNQPKPVVIVSRFREKVHDVSRFEVQSPQYSSLWSMLQISEVVIANTVIDQLQAESILLIPTAQEAGQLLKDRATVPKNCTCAYTLNRDVYYPDPNYRLYSGRGAEPARFLQVSVEEKVKETMKSLEDSKETLQSITSKVQVSQREISKLDSEIKASQKKSREYKKKMDGLRMSQAELQNQEELAPPDMSQLEDDIKQQEDLLKEAEAKLDTLKATVAEKKDKFNDFNTNFGELRAKEQDAYQTAESLKDSVSQAGNRINAALSSVEAYKKKDKEFEKKEKDLNLSLTTATENLSKAMEVAEKFQPRCDTRRRVEEVKRQYTSLEARLNQERARYGNPVAVAERYRNTRQRYKQVMEDLDRHSSLIKKIQESLLVREQRYKKFYKWLAVMIKCDFSDSLTVCNLAGSLNFNFEDETLTIHVEKQRATSLIENNVVRAKRKSGTLQKLAMMSGGERSFSTVSFIIALWQVIDSPIRILDEFDVFMDVIARNRAMKMMINAAKPGTQYIFLTPLNLDINKLPNCTLFRMPDPLRGENGEESSQEQMEDSQSR